MNSAELKHGSSISTTLWLAMEDLADSIDDIICSFENATNTTMDTLAMLIFGWILLALFLLWLGKFLYNKFLPKDDIVTSEPISTKTKLDVNQKAAVVDKSAAVAAVAVGVAAAAGSTAAAGDVVKEKIVTKTAAPVPVSAGAKSGGGGGGGYVPPTPPVRKRLSRKSPGPDLPRKNIHVKPAPKATGPDNVSVQWVNDLFQWLYNDLVVVNELVNVWIQSLNEFSKKSVAEQGVGVELVRILPESPAPTLSNVFCECDTKDDVTITCDCETTFAMQLKCFRQKGEKIETSHYRVNVNRFRARLNLVCITEKLLADLKCDGWPDIKVALAPVGNIKNHLDETPLQDVVADIVVTALRNTEVSFNCSQYPTCPRLNRHPVEPALVLPVHYDGMTTGGFHATSTPNHTGALSPMKITGDKRLLVKVMQAGNLKPSPDGNPIEPYCVVEMDEPFQKNQTSVKKNTDSPYWDEHFLFDLSANTAELMFEVYDRSHKSNRFLGLGIVGVEELLINPSQRQVISLQSRPYEEDHVTGTLTVEFLFIEGADIPAIGGKPYKLKETLRTLSPTGQTITTTKTTFATNEPLTNGNDLTDSALKELERNKQSNSVNTNKSTLIIHSVQRQPNEGQVVKVAQKGDGGWHEVPASDDTKKDQTEPGELQTSLPSDTSGAVNDSLLEPEPRGRSRKKRDLFGTLRRRLGRSKTRSKSAGRPGDEILDGNSTLSRSVSADRNRDSTDVYQLNVPPYKPGETNSRRSSLSEASGLSGASTRTYLNEASTLVLETLENGVKKHYLVPLSLAQRSRWRKKGVKLHIFNDHTFIAKHLSGGTVCQICSKSIARRIGKQGYECRDCLIKCHKHCHVKINDNCPTSTIHSMELSYIANPYSDKNIRML